MENATPRWIAVARMLRPQGRRGELLAEPLSDLPGLFIAGRNVLLTKTAHAQTGTPAVLEDVWHPSGRNAGRIVLKLANSNSISEAEQLAGHDLLMLASDLPALEADTWFVSDLLDCTLLNDGEPIGRIVDVQYAMATDGRTRLPDAAPLLEVSLASNPNAEPALIPFIRAWLDSVDLDRKRVLMHLPDGLLTLDTASDNTAHNRE